MSAKTIRKALGTLQDDPDHVEGWGDLAEAVGFGEVGEPAKPRELGMTTEALAKLLEAARRAHEMRREFDAVAHLLEIEAALAHGTEREEELVAQLARVLDDEVLDDVRAVRAYRRLLELRPGDAVAEEAIEKSEAKGAKWSELVSRYVQEAKAAGDGAFKSSLLMSASEVAYRHGRPQLTAQAKESGKKAKKLATLMEEVVLGLKEALEIDPKNRRAGMLLERIYREQENYEELAKTLEQIATEASAKEEKIAGFVRLARVLSKKMKSPERAVAAYERVLDLSPGHPEATSALVDFFTAHEMWDHLVALYEEQLATMRGPQEAGTVLQIGMVNWKMRNKPEAAEPYFERLRKYEPAHPGMLGFFREWAEAKGASGRLASILNDAYRVLPDGKDKRQLAAELAKLAEDGANAAKAIEQWRALLRQDPTNEGARASLKRLYRQSAGWNALTDLLRSELERVPAEVPAERLPILREIAEIYREHVKSDSALVTVLSQIIAIDRDDLPAVRELTRVYEALGRWRDLLATQTRLAELEQDAGAKAELYRAVARRWLEQFSNVQNAIESYEKLIEILPRDREAYEKLRELYGKRRAYKPLYDLLDKEAAAMEEGVARREMWLEMAKLAAERLDRGMDATALYKRVLDEDASAAGALDALEKQAERDKDYKTVAEVLERRAGVASDPGGDAAKLAVLQKLGVIYSERLGDHKGAMRAWRRVLELSPGHAKALRVLRDSFLAVADYDGLSELYEAHKDLEGLAEVLSGAADRAQDHDAKVDLSFRAADVYVNKLKAPERAFRAYERVLGVRPNDERAASALVPLYEHDEKWARLPSLYEVLLGHATGDDQRLALLQKLVRVAGTHLQDRGAAFGYARKAYELDPERPDALDAFESAARSAGEWGPFVDVLNARIKQKKGKKEEKRLLRAKLAEVCATELGRVDESVSAYRNLVEEDETDQVAVETLDRILRSADRREDLRWLFDVRVARANTAAKLDILNEWAVLEEEAFGAPERAATLYRRILEVVPQHGPALRALARLLRAAGDAEGAVEIIERDRDQRQGADRAAREVELARLYVDPLKRYGAALAAAKRALDDSPGDRDALSVVEALLSVGETRARAAVILEAAYQKEKNFSRQAEALEVMIATAASKNDRIELFGRLADVHEKLGEVDKAFEVVARVASEFPTELSFWDRLSVLANRTQRSAQFVEAIAQAVPPTGDTGLPEAVELDLAERAATLYDEKLGEIDRAQPYLERILARDPSNERAFGRLKQILTTREKWEELELLYERAVGASQEAPRRADLLAEVALIAEEITGDRTKAMQYYERILEIDPLHEQAVRALDALYVSAQHWDKLAALIKRRLGTATLEESVALKLRLGTVYFTHLEDPPSAIEHLEEVLQADSANREARDLVEKCLTVNGLRGRAASVLEGFYAARDDVRDLVRVLEIRLEFSTEADRRDLLARVAQLKDERLQDDAGALNTFALLVPVDPDDIHARTRMLEIARRLGAHERAAEVLVEAASRARSPQPKAEILSDVARVYEDLLNDARRAEATYKEVLAIDPHDAILALPAARSLERIYGATSRHAELADILKVEVKLEDDAVARRELYGRLGELSESMLQDPRAAVDAWKARLEDDPADEAALAALDRLYERTGDNRALVDVLRARERQATDAATRKALLVRIATTLGEKLSDVPEAILAYRTIIDDFGAERGSLAALETLYEVADRWPDLGETLETHLALADTPEERLDLLARLGQVRQLRLHNVEGSIEAYRQALSIHPAHPMSRAALEALLADADARREAATILRPLYEGEGEHTRLLRVLDIEAEFADNPADKLALYAQAVSVAEGPLSDPGRAFTYAARGLREAAQDLEFPSWLERVERLAAVTGNYKDLVELLRSMISDILDGDQQLEVTLKVAVLARTRLNDRDLARSFYQKALELRADDRRALTALESLYDEVGDGPALLDVLKRRAEAAENEAERQGLLFKQAKLCDDRLHDQPAAIAVYEQILEISSEAEALAALERLYSATERWDDLIALYERQIGTENLSPAKKATLHHGLGSVLERRLKEVERAFDQYEAALKLDPQHDPTIASLEGLMADPEHAARAAEMLEGVYLVRLDWRRVMATLEARLNSSQDPDARRLLLRRLAKLHEEQEEDYRAALETTAKLLTEDVTDESTWAELERLARVANAEGRLAEIFAAELEQVTADEPGTARLAKRTGELFEAEKNVDRALKFYRRAYSFAPEEDASSFDAIDRLLRESNRAADRVALYKEALDHRTDPTERLSTLHTIALLEETELHDDDRAIETFRAGLDIDDSDQHSLEGLSRLYARRERFRDLADLARRRAEQSALPEDEARFRLDLGRLLEGKLGDVSGAIDEYQAVVELSPPEAPSKAGTAASLAVAALEALVSSDEFKARVIELLRPIYERADDWRHLVEVNVERLKLATDLGERVAILRESAKLWEERGQDRERAFEAVRDAFAADPDDGDTRAELDRLAEATKRWDDLADVYERGSAKTEGIGQRELLQSLAKVHDARRDDPRHALAAYDRLFKLDESDIAPLEEMDTLATLLADWSTLVRVLAKKAELVLDDEDRARTWRRIGEARRDMLEDASGAIDAYERALELEPDGAFTLDNLIQLYEAKNDAARLVDLYRRRIELCGAADQDKKYEMLMLAANRQELGLEDRREAIQLLNEALGVRPGDPEAMQRLDVLYTHERLWPELLENLKLQAGAAPDDATRRATKKRIGALLAKELEDPRQALEAYREVLDGGMDEESIAAIREIGNARDDLRAEAADALEPVLRAAGRHADLADVYEVRLRAQTDPKEHAKTLRAIAEVAESHLSDPKRAQSALLRALADEPDDPALHADIERIAGQAGDEGWKRYADTLGERASAIFDAQVTTDLYVRLGRVAEEHLKDDARAAKAYVQAAEQAGDTQAILAALDRILSRLGDVRALADVLERRVAVETDGDAQAELYHRLASLQIAEFGEKARGVTTLRLALERKPDHAASREALEGLLSEPLLFDEAFEALEGVYRELKLPANLDKLYEHRVARAGDARERARARLDLARVLEVDVIDASRAQHVLEESILEDPSDEAALAEIERLAPINAGWVGAAAAFERALGQARDLPTGSLAELWVRLARWRGEKLNDVGAAENALREALKVDPENLEVLQSVEALQRAPGRERDLVATLRARAKLETVSSTKRDLLREAKALAESTVGDRELAEATLRDILAEDEADLWALEELTRLRDEAGDHVEVVRLLLRRAELAADGGEILELKHRAAETLTSKLNDAPRAIALYEEILEQQPTDTDASTRLRALYEDAGRERDLAKLLTHLIDTADNSQQRSALRLDLAHLQGTKFESPKDATETLRAILEDEPGQSDAVVALSQLLERTGQDEELAELLSSQIERARERSDASAELALEVRLGDVFEGRLKDTSRALATYEAVLEKNPEHRGALEAVARLAEGRMDWAKVAGALGKLVDMATDKEGVAEALRLAAALGQLEDNDGIERALKRALELDAQNVEVRAQLRALYEKGKNWAELAWLLVGDADLLTDGAGTASPDQVKLLRRAAEIHIRERKVPGDAVPLLERATALAPQDRELLLSLVDAYTASSRERDAASMLERVIASFGNKRTKELSLYHHRLGRALASLGDKDVALMQYDMAFKIDPGSVSVLKDLGVLALETNDLDRAQKTFRALLLQRLEPSIGITKGEVFYYLGEISAKQGDKAKAVQMLERAIENEPSLDRARTKLSELKG